MKDLPTHISLPIEALPDLRRMLLIGLHCFGEVDRITDMADFLKKFGQPCDEQLVPVHPTGAYEVTEFASALRWLEHAKEIER